MEKNNTPPDISAVPFWKKRAGIIAGILLLVVGISSVGFLMVKNKNSEPSTPSVSPYPSLSKPGGSKDESNVYVSLGDGDKAAKQESLVLNQEIAVKNTEEFTANKKVVLRGEDADIGSSWQALFIGDPQDKTWQTYQPKNVRIDVGETGSSVTFGWDDTEVTPVPYHWLIGYWNASFDPAEKFQLDKLPADKQIKWNGIWRGEDDSNAQFQTAHKTVILDLGKLPKPTTAIYAFIYKRVKTQAGQYVDFVYGRDGTSDIPFTFSLQ